MTSGRVAAERELLRQPRYTLVRAELDCRDGLRRPVDFLRVPDAVAVTAILGDGRLVLVRQMRPAVGRALLEIPAGRLEGGELPLSAARRELEEETGFRAGRLEGAGSFHPSPGNLSELMHLFVATDLEPGQPRPAHDEEIEVVLADAPTLESLLARGELVDAKTLLALELWRRRTGGASPAFRPSE